MATQQQERASSLQCYAHANLGISVILVTPEIIAPLHPSQKVTLPGEGLEDPSDMELYVLGLLDGRSEFDGDDNSTVPGSEPDETSFHGPWVHAENVD